MTRFIFLVFGFLALAFYEFSGGADFSPTASRLAAMEARQSGTDQSSPAEAEVPREVVARADLSLVSFDEVMAERRVQASKPDPALVPRPAVAAATGGATIAGVAAARQADVASADLSLEEATRIAATDRPTPTLAAQTRPEPSLTGVAQQPLRAAAPAATGIRFEGTTLRASSGAVGNAAERRYVSGDLVNLRAGPGTAYGVVGQLPRGTEVEVLGDNGAGWVRLRSANGGADGWMADFLLSGG